MKSIGELCNLSNLLNAPVRESQANPEIKPLSKIVIYQYYYFFKIYMF